MVAVAHGYERLITLLINHRARVTYIPPGREEERFHARAVARMIDSKDKRVSILQLLKLNASEKQKMCRKVSGKSFLQAINEPDHDTVENFMLLRPHMNIPDSIPCRRSEIDPTVVELLDKELITMQDYI